MSKKAILVVSFGTSYHNTCAQNIQAIEHAIAAAFPGWAIRRAFTSGMIRSKLQKRDNIAVDSVEQALRRLADEGFDTVLCQPTHIINGEEFDDIRNAAAPFSATFAVLKIGAPLLTSTEDYKALTHIISHAYPPKEGTAYCLLGHGSEHHPADASYAALDYHFKSARRSDIFVGTVEGFPDFYTMLQNIKASGARRCVLFPLMVVAGDHARNDMASDDDTSWKSMLQQEGFAVECVLKGLGEYPEVRERYVQHVHALIAEVVQ